MAHYVDTSHYISYIQTQNSYIGDLHWYNSNPVEANMPVIYFLQFEI